MPMALLLLAQALADPAVDLVAVARLRTAAEAGCPKSDTTDVTVCGLRTADRFRAPLLTAPAIDPANDVRHERTALLHRTTPLQDLGPYQVGGGMVGLTMTTTVGASGGGTRVRGWAP